MSDGAATRPAETASTTVTSVSMSICSALLRLTSGFLLSAFCASNADDAIPMVSATQRAPMPLIFFMPLSRVTGTVTTAAAAVRKTLESESADHRDSVPGKSNNHHAIIAAPHGDGPRMRSVQPALFCRVAVRPDYRAPGARRRPGPLPMELDDILVILLAGGVGERLYPL